MVNTTAVQNAGSAKLPPKGQTQRMSDKAGDTGFRDLLDLAGKGAQDAGTEADVLESPGKDQTVSTQTPNTKDSAQNLKKPETSVEEQDNHAQDASGENVQKMPMQNIPLYMGMQNMADMVKPVLLSVVWKAEMSEPGETVPNATGQMPVMPEENAGQMQEDMPMTSQTPVVDNTTDQAAKIQNTADQAAKEMMIHPDESLLGELGQSAGVKEQSADGQETVQMNAKVSNEKAADVRLVDAGNTGEAKIDAGPGQDLTGHQNQTDGQQTGQKAVYAGEQQHTEPGRTDAAEVPAAQSTAGMEIPDKPKARAEETVLQGKTGESTQSDSALMAAQQNHQQVQMPSDTARKEPVDAQVHVKVREPEEIPKAVLNQLVQKLAANQREFTVQIEPANLGKLLVKVLQSQEGTTVSIMCTNSKTLEVLAQNAKQIGSIMEDNLGSPTVIYVDKSEENYLNQENSGSQGRQDADDQSRRQDEGKNEKEQNMSFLQQLRLGLAPIGE